MNHIIHLQSQLHVFAPMVEETAIENLRGKKMIPVWEGEYDVVTPFCCKQTGLVSASTSGMRCTLVIEGVVRADDFALLTLHKTVPLLLPNSSILLPLLPIAALTHIEMTPLYTEE